jgi:UDP-glucuronate 4-epimerase
VLSLVDRAGRLGAGSAPVTLVLVTGAAGFIASHACTRLLARGDHVIGLDNLNDYYSPLRKRATLAEISASAPNTDHFTFVQGDIRDRALINELFARNPIRTVLHFAAMAGVRASVEDPWLYYDVNLTGTLNLLECIRQQPIPANFVLASTSSAYGNCSALPFVETEAADRPLAPYPASKRAAELLGFTYHHLYGLDFTALRFFTVYGPRGRPDMMAYKVLDSAYGGPPVPYYNAGHMHRDWTFVDDIIDGVIAAADRRLGYEVINLGRGEPVLLADFVAHMQRYAPTPPRLLPQSMLSADVEYTFADISKARRLLDYDPKVSVAEGIERFVAWYTRHVL